MKSITEISMLIHPLDEVTSPSKRNEKEREDWKMGSTWTKEEEEEFEPLPINASSFPFDRTCEESVPLSRYVSNRHDFYDLFVARRKQNLI